jgi:hypothetical protein
MPSGGHGIAQNLENKFESMAAQPPPKQQTLKILLVGSFGKRIHCYGDSPPLFDRWLLFVLQALEKQMYCVCC